METSGQDNNPYVSPLENWEPANDPAARENAQFARTLKEFRRHLFVLGIVWCFFASVGLFITTVDFVRTFELLEHYTTEDYLGILLGFAIALGYLALGILHFCKVIPAVYVGLALNYLMLALFVLTLSPCGMLVGVFIFLPLVLYGHHVIKIAKTLRKFGVPLNAKPAKTALRRR